MHVCILLSDVQNWDNELASVATNLVRTCELQTESDRVLGPNTKTYRYDGFTGYFPKSADIPDQIRGAFNESKFRYLVSGLEKWHYLWRIAIGDWLTFVMSNMSEGILQQYH